MVIHCKRSSFIVINRKFCTFASLLCSTSFLYCRHSGKNKAAVEAAWLNKI